jgi:hypothetical protein
MTKYVLNSGGIKRKPELKRKFHRELIASLGNNPKFVLCNFAEGREYWEPKFGSYADGITEDMPEDVYPSFELAMPATFTEQCRRADIIYFLGGDDYLLRYWLQQFELIELFKDKVVATTSASSDALVAQYWTCDWRQCADGFGILPIKFIPHYQSSFGDLDPRGPIDWQKAYDELAAYGDTSLPIHALQEGEYIVFEK